FWVAIWAAVLLALPVILWQIWSFLAPAFDESAQRAVRWLVLGATVLGIAGLAFGYFIVLPPAIHFLTNYGRSNFHVLSRALDYDPRTGRRVLCAHWVLPIAAARIEHEGVAIRDGRIAAVGSVDELGDGERYDDAVILPGFVNAHSHLEYAVYAGFGGALTE